MDKERMRAHFLRGEDPKATMNIGDKFLRIRDRMNMGARIICRDYELDIKTIQTEMRENGISVEFPGRQPNRAHPYKYWMHYDKEREHYWAGYSNIDRDEIEDQKPCDDLEKAMLETRIFLNKFNWTAKGAKYESLNFQRGQESMDAMEIGRVTERKMKLAYKQIKEACEEMMKEWAGEPPYMKIKENVQKEFMEIGIEYSPGGSTYFYYLVYVPDADEEENMTNWAAGYKINHKSKFSISPNVKQEEQDEIPYDTLEDAINKMKWWYKNL